MSYSLLACFFALILSISVGAQTKHDTLVLGHEKISLQPVELYYDLSQDGPVLVPSEYKEWNGKTVPVPYGVLDQYSYEITHDVFSLGTSSIFSFDSVFKPEIFFPDSADTLFYKRRELNFTPYVNLENHRVCGLRIWRLHKDTLTRYNLNATWAGMEIQFVPELEGSVHVGDIYYLQDFYYRKEERTYYLDLPLIIKIVE